MTEKNPLGTQATWGKVGYAGMPFAAAAGTYLGIDSKGVAWTAAADSGAVPETVANLKPLILAALYEAGFAAEAGPLTTWSN